MPAASIDIHVMDMDGAGIDLRRLSALLDDEEGERAERFRFDQDRRRYIARRGRLREILSQSLGCPASRIRFAWNAFGKPFVKEANLRFNVSHSRNIALVAIAHGRELGCDIELRDPRFASEQIPERFFSPSEIRALRDLDPTPQVEAFFNCWTRKEAYIKARGYGLSLPLDSFDVSLAPDEPAALLRGCNGWSVKSFEPVAGFQAAVVAEATDWRLNFQADGASHGCS
jgi:4'-phosphopantetheinyl transferase